MYEAEIKSLPERPPPPYTNAGARVQETRKTLAAENGGTALITIASGSETDPSSRYCNSCLAAAVIFLICLFIVGATFPYPLQASCIVKWKFADPCIRAIERIRCQILDWSACSNCGSRVSNSSSRCLYTLKDDRSTEPNKIHAIHVTPQLNSFERINIFFEDDNGTCIATGESVSKKWFLMFDDGVNYCNLHNLVIGAGFDKHPIYLELTSNAICTQFTTARCD